MKPILLIIAMAAAVLFGALAFLANAHAGQPVFLPLGGPDWSNVNIDGGTIDGTTIGGTASAEAEFTTMTATTANIPRYAGFMAFDETTSVATGDGKAGAMVPDDLAGYVITDAYARVGTAGVTGSTILVLRRTTTAGASADAYTVTITAGLVDSSVQAGSEAARTLAAGDLLQWDVDSVHSGTAPLGLWPSIKIVHP